MAVGGCDVTVVTRMIVTMGMIGMIAIAAVKYHVGNILSLDACWADGDSAC